MVTWWLVAFLHSGCYQPPRTLPQLEPISSICTPFAICWIICICHEDKRHPGLFHIDSTNIPLLSPKHKYSLLGNKHDLYTCWKENNYLLPPSNPNHNWLLLHHSLYCILNTGFPRLDKKNQCQGKVRQLLLIKISENSPIRQQESGKLCFVLLHKDFKN